MVQGMASSGDVTYFEPSIFRLGGGRVTGEGVRRCSGCDSKQERCLLQLRYMGFLGPYRVNTDMLLKVKTWLPKENAPGLTICFDKATP